MSYAWLYHYEHHYNNEVKYEIKTSISVCNVFSNGNYSKRN